MKTLTKFDISIRESDFVLHLQDDAGGTAEYIASPEQLDALIDALDDMLSENEEEVFEVADDERPRH